MKILWTTSSFGFQYFPTEWNVIPNPFGRRLSEEEAIKFLSAENPDGIIAGVEPLTRRVMESSPNLKVISRCGVGLDSVDTYAAADLGIQVLNTPTAPVQSVAELTVALMLAILRKVAVIDSRMKEGKWFKAKGFLLGGKTVGVLGCGRIGSHVATILQAFGCRLIGYDPFIKEHPIIEMVDLTHLWQNSDLVSLHMPSTNKNRHIIDSMVLEEMKKSAFLVNTARGALIDEKALAEALKNGTIAGAALDVFENEPYSGPLTSLGDRILLTSHIASSAIEGRVAMESEAVANLVEGFARIL